jgi:hypothetical protein
MMSELRFRDRPLPDVTERFRSACVPSVSPPRATQSSTSVRGILQRPERDPQPLHRLVEQALEPLELGEQVNRLLPFHTVAGWPGASIASERRRRSTSVSSLRRSDAVAEGYETVAELRSDVRKTFGNAPLALIRFELVLTRPL